MADGTAVKPSPSEVRRLEAERALKKADDRAQACNRLKNDEERLKGLTEDVERAKTIVSETHAAVIDCGVLTKEEPHVHVWLDDRKTKFGAIELGEHNALHVRAVDPMPYSAASRIRMGYS